MSETRTPSDRVPAHDRTADDPADGGVGTPTRRHTDVTRPLGGSPPPERRGGSFGRWIVTIVLILLGVALIGLLLLGRLIAGFDPFNRQTVDRTQPAVLLALQDLSEYRAATGEFQVIVDSEDTVRNLPRQIAGERTLFVAVGTVDAAVDFSALDESAVTVDEARERATVRLPGAELTEAAVDPDRSYVFSRERGLLDRLAGLFSDNPTSERELYLLAERRLERAATESGLVDLANRNTEAMLRSLLTSLGFTDVTVVFD
ncbi:MAG: DUF4230 domain-containing protein [Actinobacteria bacterium]|nr:DUF4230 domain-containing protein [Actinomycetota bacterium]